MLTLAVARGEIVIIDNIRQVLRRLVQPLILDQVIDEIFNTLGRQFNKSTKASDGGFDNIVSFQEANVNLPNANVLGDFYLFV